MSQHIRQTPAPVAAAVLPDAGYEHSLTATLLAPLHELQSLSQTLFLALSPPQSKPPSIPPLSAFLECDKALASAISLAHVHQLKQRKIDALEAEILDLDTQWRQICRELAAGKAELEEIIGEGEGHIKAIDQAKKGVYTYDSFYLLKEDLIQHSTLKHLYHILNYSHTLRVSVHLHLHLLICPTSPCPANPLRHCFSRPFQTKKKCVVAVSTQRPPLACWEKHIPSEDVSPIALAHLYRYSLHS